MRFCLITNSVSPHQLPLARCLVERLGEDNFRYVSTGRLASERKSLGWNDEKPFSWVLEPAVDECIKDEAESWMNNADVVLCGNRDVDLFEKRAAKGLVTFYMSERWFKPRLGAYRMLLPSFFQKLSKICSLINNEKFFYLPIGVYAAEDAKHACRLTGKSALTMPMWGYFVNASQDNESLVTQDDDIIRILWFGRFLKWKETCLLIEAFSMQNEMIKQKIRCRVIGMGPEESVLKKMAEDLNVADLIEFKKAVPLNEIRREIQRSDIGVVTSNAREGWGVAVNEIMLEGRCVITSDATGAGATLVQDGVNGLLFKSGLSRDLALKLQRIIQNDDLRNRLAGEGKASICRDWLPDVAAERLIKFCEAGMNRKSLPEWESGSLSRT